MSFDDVRASLDAIAAAERSEPLIDPENGTRWWLHDKRAAHCVVLLHGFTNNPRQYAELGPYLHDAGYNVIAPRFAYHGFADRMTTAPARLTMNDLIETTLQAVTLAAGAGKRVSVAGISLGGAIAAWLAPRVAIDTAVAVAPFFGIKPIFGAANDVLGSALDRLPNAFLWWDPIHKEQQLPRHGYPRFSTHALGQTLKLSAQTEKGGWRKSGRVVGLLNGNDPVVNNAFARRRLEALRARGLDVRIDVRTDLPKQHDIIEPTLESAPIALSYPWILSALGGP
jgi:pimeloyl-ACP methyl ester carboxylesterase